MTQVKSSFGCSGEYLVYATDAQSTWENVRLCSGIRIDAIVVWRQMGKSGAWARCLQSYELAMHRSACAPAWTHGIQQVTLSVDLGTQLADARYF